MENPMFKWLMNFFATSAATQIADQLLTNVKRVPTTETPVEKRKAVKPYKERDKYQFTEAQLKHLFKKRKDGTTYADLTVYANTKYGINKAMATYHRLIKQYEESLNKGN
jgi:hypothetical protein